MNAVIHCEIRLSKKLEKLIEDGNPIDIYISALKDGAGTGYIRIVTKENVTTQQLTEVGETNLIVRNPRGEELAPDLTNQAPVQSLFVNDPESTPQVKPQVGQQVTAQVQQSIQQPQYQPQQPQYQPQQQVEQQFTPQFDPNRYIPIPPAKDPFSEYETVVEQPSADGFGTTIIVPPPDPNKVNQQYRTQNYPTGGIAITDPRSSPVTHRPPPQAPAQPISPRQQAELKLAMSQQRSLNRYPAPQRPQQYQPATDGRRAPVNQTRQAAQEYANRAYDPRYAPQQQQPYIQPNQPVVPPIGFDNPILSYDELMAEIQKLQGIEQPVPQLVAPPGTDIRYAMLQHEQSLDSMPHLNRPCYVRNDIAGHMHIADLGRSVGLGEVINLSNLPARKIIDSRHLRELCRNNKLTFTTWEDFTYSLQQPDPEVKSYLPTGGLEDVEGGVVDNGRPSDMYVDRYERHYNRRPNYGMRRSGTLQFDDGGNYGNGNYGDYDPNYQDTRQQNAWAETEFAELVSALPVDRPSNVPQYQQPAPKRTSSIAHAVRRMGAEGDESFIENANDIYTP